MTWAEYTARTQGVFGTTANYAAFASDGTLSLTGTATAWDDLDVTTNIVKLPGDSPPAWTTYAHGIGGGKAFAVLGFGVGEYVDFTVQTSHSMKANDLLHAHIHFTVPANDTGKKIKFQLDVITAGVDTAFAVPTGSPFANEYTLTAAEAGYHRLLEIGEIPGNTTVSTVYQCRLTRIAASSNDYGSDVYVLYIDSHYEKDGLGSATEYTK